VFPRRGGRWPELGNSDEREWVGRFLGRIHAVGRASRFKERGSLSIEDLGRNARDFVLDGDWMPDYLATKYAEVTDELLEAVEARAFNWGGAALGRILGDCHRGNILWTDLGPHFVDLDDCLTGPAIQDLWMLLAGGREEMRTELQDLLKGYEQFLPFDRREIALIEPLRALRMIHYSAWLARRWHDPAFPMAFPWFAEPRYWEQHHRALQDQLAAVLEEPLEL
jgi:Ser/Thr protein kinase RdoA (MazF antagonist)